MGISESRKFAVGTIHENGGGKFEVLERYLGDDSKTIMMKYRFLEDDRIEINKEVNVNASIWKFRKNRGLTENDMRVKETQRWDFEAVREKLESNSDKIDQVLTIFNSSTLSSLFQAIRDGQQVVEHLRTSHENQYKTLVDLLNKVNTQQNQIDSLVRDSVIINKLLDRL